MVGRRTMAGCALLVALGVAAPADARAVQRADLVVSDGTVSVSSGRLTGSFVVRNTGDARAGASSAALTVRVPGRTRTLKRFAVPALGRSAVKTVAVSLKLPGGLPSGALPVRACADRTHAVREGSESNNCRTVGTLGAGVPGASSVPSDPVAFAKDTVFTRNSPLGTYWIDVPSAYDATNRTPVTLLVWLHGCGGESSGDIYTVSPGGGQDWISIALGGREDDCWNVNTDGPAVLAAIADVKTHFNINPRRVILGGYSSGGDLAYRTAFTNARMFAGVLAENTSPFRDTGLTQSAALAGAAWKFHVVALAHTEDDTYPIAGVRAETDAMAAAGFPITRIERPGHHYDDDTPNSGTDHDLRAYLLPHLDDGWLAP